MRSPEKLPLPEAVEVVDEPKCFCGRLVRPTGGATEYAAWLQDVKAGRIFVVPEQEEKSSAGGEEEPAKRIDKDENFLFPTDGPFGEMVSRFGVRVSTTKKMSSPVEIFRGDDGVGIDANVLADLALPLV